jgi:hypothetical protein
MLYSFVYIWILKSGIVLYILGGICTKSLQTWHTYTHQRLNLPYACQSDVGYATNRTTGWYYTWCNPFWFRAPTQHENDIRPYHLSRQLGNDVPQCSSSSLSHHVFLSLHVASPGIVEMVQHAWGRKIIVVDAIMCININLNHNARALKI